MKYVTTLKILLDIVKLKMTSDISTEQFPDDVSLLDYFSESEINYVPDSEKLFDGSDNEVDNTQTKNKKHWIQFYTPEPDFDVSHNFEVRHFVYTNYVCFRVNNYIMDIFLDYLWCEIRQNFWGKYSFVHFSNENYNIDVIF